MAEEGAQFLQLGATRDPPSGPAPTACEPRAPRACACAPHSPGAAHGASGAALCSLPAAAARYTAQENSAKHQEKSTKEVRGTSAFIFRNGTGKFSKARESRGFRSQAVRTGGGAFALRLSPTVRTQIGEAFHGLGHAQ